MIRRVLAGRGEAEVTEKKSRFIAVCAPVADEEAARALWAERRKRFYDARHHCFAYRGQSVERSNDDGEPGGTAGLPMLTALRGAGVVDAAVVVTRYFGGTLLGAGGLARAYGAAAKAALDAAGVISQTPASRMAVTVAYPLEACVRAALAAYTLVDTAYADAVTFTVLAPEGGEGRFAAAMTDAAYGDLSIVELGKDFIETSIETRE